MISFKSMNFLKGLGVWQQISLLLGVLIISAGSAAVYASILYEKQYAEEQLIQQNERILSFLIAGSSEAIISEDLPVLKTLVDQVMRADDDITMVKVLNEKQQVLIEKISKTFTANSGFIKFSQTINLEQENFGSIEIYWDSQSFSDKILKQTRHIIAMVVVIIILMTTAFYLIIQHFLLRPIGRINRKILQLSANMKVRPLQFNAFTAIEFYNLAESVNSLQISQEHREEILEDLEIAKDKAEASNEAKNKFLAVMSHEIRTPINGITGMAEVIKEGVSESDKIRYLDVILNSSVSLMKIVDDILDFSRIEKGKLNLSKKAFSLDKILNQIEGEFLVNMKRENINFVITKPDLSSYKLIGDGGHLQQVLENILSNAFKFTEEGKVHLEIETGHIDEHKIDLKFKIKDTGIGISEENKEKIFQEFHQLNDGFNRRYMGLGLGLALSQRIIHKMGGQIFVESEIGKGSCFSFTLTLGKEKLKTQQTSINQKIIPVVKMIKIKKPFAKIPQKQILLVEDSITNQEVVSAMLQKSRYQLRIVSNGKEAVEFVDNCERQNLDAILMDISMPEMDGVTATRIIRSMPGMMANIPIIALTAHAYRDEKDLFIASGMDDYLAKPLRKENLFNVLGRWVSQIH